MQNHAAPAIPAGKGLGAAGQQVKGLADHGQIIAAVLGEFQGASFAQKQGTPQKTFKAADVLADRGLRQVQLAGRPRERQVAGRGLKSAQPGQRREGVGLFAHAQCTY